MLVLLVAAAKKHFEKQAQIMSTAQSRQAVKADWLTCSQG
jgi:hypothetical protein